MSRPELLVGLRGPTAAGAAADARRWRPGARRWPRRGRSGAAASDAAGGLPSGGAAATGGPGVPGALRPPDGRRILAPSRRRSTPSITTWSPTSRPLVTGDLLAVGDAGLDDADRDRVVGLDQIDEGARLAALDRGDRHDGGVLHRVDQQADIDELVGEQRLVLVVEHGAQLHRAGRGVDLVVDGGELAGGRAGSSAPGRAPSPAASRPPRRRLRTGGSASSGMVNITEIGCSWVMTQMPVGVARW